MSGKANEANAVPAVVFRKCRRFVKACFEFIDYLIVSLLLRNALFSTRGYQRMDERSEKRHSQPNLMRNRDLGIDFCQYGSSGDVDGRRIESA